MSDQVLINRRELLQLGAAGTALGASSLILPGLARADSPESVQVAEIYQLQAAFHDLATRFAADAFLAGTVKDVAGTWVFWNMTAGKSFPLSYDHYYFP